VSSNLAPEVAAERGRLALEAVMRRPGLTAFEVARVLGLTAGYANAPNVNSAAKALERLEGRGLVAHVDEPAGNMAGYRRCWFPAPVNT
jgi:hypothetical protein